MNRRSFLILLLILGFAAPAPLLLGADKKDAADSKEAELHARVKERYPRIKELKKQGIVGETFEGYLDFVKDKKADAKKLIDEENADRKEVYKLIAEKQGTTPEKVADRAAKLHFEKAAPGEFLKDSSGKWTKKT